MSNAPDTETDMLFNSLKTNVLKIKRFYDGSDRVITQYEAVANATNGQPCIRTDYAYVGVSTLLDAMKESMSTWQSAWDI